MRRLRFQLIAVLILVALLPCLPAVFTVKALLHRSLDPWMQELLSNGNQAGLESTRQLLEERKEAFRTQIASGVNLDTLPLGDLQAVQERPAPSPGSAQESPKEREESRESESSREAEADRRTEVAPGPRDSSEVLIHVGPERISLNEEEYLIAQVSRGAQEPVWVRFPLARELAERADRITASIRFVETLRIEQQAVLRSLLATFLVIYAVILGLVLVLGLYLASRITRPLEALGQGMARVADGDLETKVPTRHGGQLGKLLTSFNEMTTRLRTQQEELLRLEKAAAWQEMARRLAHEIKNPLTPIQLAAQEIRDAYRGEDAEFQCLLREGATIIEEEVGSLRRLVQEFSQFARLPEPEMRWARVDALLSEVAGLFGPERVLVGPMTGLASGAKSASDAGQTPEEIWCDPEQLHRLLVNLVNNALAAQEESGRMDPVSISASMGADASVRIEVQDRGPGVPVERRRRIFEPNFSTRAEGMGLGLAIVESIVRAHGGSIEVTDRPGGGAVFSLRLPTRLEAHLP